MKFSQEIDRQFYQISHFDADSVSVRTPASQGEAILRLQQSFVITPDKLNPKWQITEFSQITTELLLELVNQQKPELLLLGCGVKHLFLHPSIYAPLLQQGVAFEIMANSAACRTYNALTADGRAVMMALIA